MKTVTLLPFIALALLASVPAEAQNYYYPPLNDTTWARIAPASLGWDTAALDTLLTYLGRKNSTGFVVLHEGRIVVEQYWEDWNAQTRQEIASAGKSVTAFLTGIAQEEGKLNIGDPTSKYLGKGWTSAPPEKEDLITIRHQLTMSTGLDDALPATPDIPDPDNCLEPGCLVYKADPGTRWAYHNAPYRLILDVLESATGTNRNLYSREKLYDRIGMSRSFWFDYIMVASTRDMARYGHLILSKGVWDGDTLLRDRSYLDAMTGTSQDLNRSYGYLWWLNGKGSYMLPTLQLVFRTDLFPSAPPDMFAALGKNDRKIYVVPSLNLVVARHGSDAGDNLYALSSFDYGIWERLMKVINPASTAAHTDADIHETELTALPNPARDRVRLRIGLKTPERVTIRLHDPLGRTLLLVDKAMEAGVTEESLSLSELNIPDGVHYLRMTTSSGSLVRPVIVAR